MNKRDVMTKGMALGTLSVIIAGTGGKSVFAEEKSDWKDELLSKYDYFSLHNAYKQEAFEPYPGEKGLQMKSSTTLHLYKEENKWVIGHFHNEYIQDEVFPNDRIATNLEGAYTKFDTLGEAYAYGKELKQKHYA
jgi:hypothetical protein